MISLDDLLDNAGLGELPPDERQRLKALVHDTLERRVGARLAARMSDAQLVEFKGLLDRDERVTAAFLDRYAEGWRLRAGELSVDELGDFARACWLDVRAPDYPDVVRAAVDELDEELRRKAAEIIAASRTP